MKIINSVPHFNLINHGWNYVCQMDDGSFWLRATSGKWVKIELSSPMDTLSVAADFDKYFLSGNIYTENDLKVDDASQIIVDPVKYIPPPEIDPIGELPIEESLIEEPPIEEPI